MTTTIAQVRSDITLIATQQGDYLGTADNLYHDLTLGATTENGDSRFYWDDFAVDREGNEDTPEVVLPYGDETRRIIDEEAGGVVMYVAGDKLADHIVNLLSIFPPTA